jgi:hypothetical protein
MFIPCGIKDSDYSISDSTEPAIVRTVKIISNQPINEVDPTMIVVRAISRESQLVL